MFYTTFFYGEGAQDLEGLSKEFFGLCVNAIKAKYFDDGLRMNLSSAYKMAGLIIALSILQNGKIFFRGDTL